MVDAIISFYKFLTAMHSETSGLGNFKYPPPTGWPHITRDLFPYYTDDVVDLIRHLPYYNDERFFVLPDTKHNAIIWWEYGDGYDDEDSSDDQDERWSNEWKTSPAYAPEDFFEQCKEQFRIMNWMPVLDNVEKGKIIELYRHQEFTGENLTTMKILRDAGWPG
ncbi:hypothetical protein ONS96_009577 [Cadophora gregata f. sp. sojae]|nr:hypothetical protein ONS96_009577 [Cadophora gregata f. sp. sojae]